MRKIAMLAMALVLCLNLISAGSVWAEVTEEVVVKNGWIFAYQVETNKTVKDCYMIPPFDIPEQDLPKILKIIRKGEGEYVLKEAEEFQWQLGFPMERQKSTIATVSIYKNGQWSQLHNRILSEAKEESWRMSFFLAVLVAGLLSIAFVNQWKNAGDKKILGIYALILVPILLMNVDFFHIADFYMPTVIWSAVMTISFLMTFSIKRTHIVVILLVNIAAVVAFRATFSGQEDEFGIFLAGVCVISYLLAKLAKWLFLNKKPEEPTILVQ